MLNRKLSKMIRVRDNEDPDCNNSISSSASIGVDISRAREAFGKYLLPSLKGYSGCDKIPQYSVNDLVYACQELLARGGIPSVHVDMLEKCGVIDRDMRITNVGLSCLKRYAMRRHGLYKEE